MLFMRDTITYSLAKKEDIEKIRTLLVNAELPATDVDGDKIDFIIAVNEKSELAGCIGIERYGKDGLLRSFAVASDYRNKGIGRDLLSRLFSLSKKSGIDNLHLLTTTAEKFFDRAGFQLLSREDAPASIKSTAEFLHSAPPAQRIWQSKQKLK